MDPTLTPKLDTFQACLDELSMYIPDVRLDGAWARLMATEDAQILDQLTQDVSPTVQSNTLPRRI